VNFKLVFVGLLHEGRERCGHFEEAISQELKTLIVWTHAALEVDLLFTVFVGVVRILRERFQRQGWADTEIHDLASVHGNKVALESVYDRRQHVTHHYEWGGKLHQS
jgi:hypothetical protein